MIDGVSVKKCNWLVDDRGKLVELFREDDEAFVKFGQCYVTVCDVSTYKPIIKAWHYHEKQYDNFVVMRGKLKLVLFDDRADSPTKDDFQEVIIDSEVPRVVTIPPYVWHGFMALGNEPAYVLNVCSEPYNHECPDEIRKELHEIEYDWDVTSQ